MSVEWEAFLQEVMPDCPGCPIQLAENAIRNSAIEFCNEGRSWRDQIDDVTTTGSTSTYPLTSATDSEVIFLYKLKHDDQTRPLPTIPVAHLATARLSTTEQKPRWYNAPTPLSVELFPVPDQQYILEAWATLKPTKTANEGPDFLYNDWLEVISHGAKARLKAMTVRPWGDKSMVKYHRREFINGYVEARIRDAKSNVASSSTLRPQQFGTYRSGRGRI